jgi:hypothetical protein
VTPRLIRWVSRLHAVAYWLLPLLPGTATAILGILTASRIRKAPPLFPRVA